MDKKVYELLNDQINKEFYSAYLYLSFADYYEEEGLSGFANWYEIQAQEERDHALILRNYLHENGCKVKLGAIAQPDLEFTSHLGPLEAALEHEKYITSTINDIYDAAMEAKDWRTMKFLDWFIGEEGTYVGHYGVEGKDWEWVDSKSFFGGDKSISRLVPDIEALWNSGSFPRADKAEIRYATTMDPEKIYTDNTYALVHAAQTYEPYYVNHHIPDVVWCTDEDVKTKVANYSTTINDYVKSTDTQFIMGQLDINDDEAWNAYLKGLNDRGLEDYLENLAVYYGLE